MWTSVCTAKGQEGTRCQGQQYLPARWGWTRDRGKRGTSFFILCISVMSDFLYQTRSNFLKFNRKRRWLRFFRAGRGPQANPEPQGGQDRPAGPGPRPAAAGPRRAGSAEAAPEAAADRRGPEAPLAVLSGAVCGGPRLRLDTQGSSGPAALPEVTAVL